MKSAKKSVIAYAPDADKIAKMVDKYIANSNGVYINVLKNNNRLLSGYYPFHIVYFISI